MQRLDGEDCGNQRVENSTRPQEALKEEVKRKSFRERIYEELLPHYLALGVDYNTFFNSNPFELKAFDKAFKLQRAINDEQDWRLGIYFAKAIGSSFSKDIKYPEKPYLNSEIDSEDIVDSEANERLAESELDCWIRALRTQKEIPETIISDTNKETRT